MMGSCVVSWTRLVLRCTRSSSEEVIDKTSTGFHNRPIEREDPEEVHMIKRRRERTNKMTKEAGP